MDVGQGEPEVAGAPGVRGCCFSQVRLGSEEVEKGAQGPRVVGLTYTAAESFQLWLYCVVVGILKISAPAACVINPATVPVVTLHTKWL